MEQNLEERVRKDPSSRLFAPLADSYRKKGDTRRAIEILMGGLSNHPGYVSARVLLAKCYEDLGDWERAREEWLNVLKVDSGNLVALKGMGQICHWLRRPEESEKWFRLYLEHFPDDNVIRRNLERLESDSGSVTGPDEGWDRRGEDREAAAEEPPVVEPAEVKTPGYAEPVVAGPDLEEHQFEEADATDRDLGGYGEEYQAVGPEEIPGSDFEDESVETMTLAEIYAQQGFYERAIDIYKRILAHDPGNTRIGERLVELEGKLTRSMEMMAAEEEKVPSPAAGREREDSGESREEGAEDQPLQIDVNEAGALDLETIPGVGPVIAQKILVERERNGPFTDHHDLERVPGLGRKTIERILPYLVFGTGTDRDIDLLSELNDLIGAEEEKVYHEEEVGGNKGPGFAENVGADEEEDGGEGESEFEEFKRWLRNLRK